MERDFADQLRNSPAAKYIAFDFHHQCRGMRYDRLSTLVEQVSDDLEKQAFFFEEADNVQIKQEGVFRTNCIDNLDRTNVVQGLLARYSLTQQLMKLGIFNSTSQKISDYPAFESLFRNTWANNADVLSMQYSGTGALKADFTRTGKRSLQGALNDGVNSLTRYVLNNFYDGFRQDSLDLFLGNYAIDPQNPSPFQKGDKYLLYGILAVAFILFVISLMIPMDNWVHSLLTAIFWLVAIFVSYKLMLRNGKRFVNRPMLFLKE